jgi:hypothetical protein
MKRIATLNEGYYFNEKTEKLEKYELIKAEFTLTEDELIRYYCKLGGTETVIDSNDLVVYRSEECFKSGDRCPLVKMSDIHIPTKKSDWAFRNGKAEQVDMTTVGFTLDNHGVRVASGEKFYATPTDVYKHNDYIVKEADGSERKVVSIASKMALNDKQKALLGEFEELISKMKEANLDLVYDTEECSLAVFNYENAVEKANSYDSYEDDGYTAVDDFAVFVKGRCDYYGYDDSYQIKFKE